MNKYFFNFLVMLSLLSFLRERFHKESGEDKQRVKVRTKIKQRKAEQSTCNPSTVC